jgi:hypothetical protein
MQRLWLFGRGYIVSGHAGIGCEKPFNEHLGRIGGMSAACFWPGSYHSPPAALLTGSIVSRCSPFLKLSMTVTLSPARRERVGFIIIR